MAKTDFRTTISDESKKAVEVYDKISYAYAAKFSEPSDHIGDFLNLIPRGGRIIDVGCGPGVDSEYMLTKGFEVVGIDLSLKMLKLARKKNPNAIFQQEDIREINFEQGTFDGILASYSLIHIPKKDIPNVLKTFFKILRPNGIICIGIQEGESREVSIAEPLKSDEKIFVNVISANELHNLLERNRFTVLSEFVRKADNKEIGELNFNKLVVIAKKKQ